MGSINKSSLLRRKKRKGKPKDLHWSVLKYCEEGDHDAVKGLLDEGAKINVTNNDGETGTISTDGQSSSNSEDSP